MTDDNKKNIPAEDQEENTLSNVSSDNPATDQEGQQYIVIETPDMEEGPELDQLTLKRIQSLNKALKKLGEQLNKAYTPIASNGPALSAVLKDINAKMDKLNKALIPPLKNFYEYFSENKWALFQEIIEQTRPLQKIAQEMEELEPYLNAELQKPEYEGKSLEGLFDEAETDSEGLPIESSLFMRAMAAARAAKDAIEAKEEPPRAAVKRAEIVEYPLDKPNSIIWNLLEEDTRGQISFNMAKYGSKQQIPAYYAINFDELGSDITITKRLLPFDKRVYIAVSALFNAGNNVITLSQIYYAMGNLKRPSGQQLKKINDAITKMTGARIYFDNEQEAAKYKYNRFKYDGSLLPLERGTAIVNGQLANAAIHIFREPPLITFAKQRKQITSIDINLLQSPVSKTDANLKIDDYLIERISKAKNGKGKNCRILLKTLYDHADITTKKQKQRAPEKIEIYLNHYQQRGFITRFTMAKDGITIYW